MLELVMCSCNRICSKLSNNTNHCGSRGCSANRLGRLLPEIWHETWVLIHSRWRFLVRNYIALLDLNDVFSLKVILDETQEDHSKWKQDKQFRMPCSPMWSRFIVSNFHAKSERGVRERSRQRYGTALLAVSFGTGCVFLSPLYLPRHIYLRWKKKI